MCCCYIEDDCEECERKEIYWEECRTAAKILFWELYMTDNPREQTIDWCMGELISYLDAIEEWPKDQNNNYISLKLRKTS